MIWQDYRKLYLNAIKTYSPKFKKELQRQVDTYCDTQDLNAISDKGIKKTIQNLHIAMGVKMAQISEKNVSKSVKGYYGPEEFKSKQTDLFTYVMLTYLELKGLDEIAGEITQTTKNQIQQYLAKSIEEGLTMPETIKLLRTADLTSYRATMIARTETGRAANIGSMVGVTATGLVTIKEWIAARDARTRRVPPDAFDHYHMDGTKIPYDEKFNVKTKNGGFEQMLHPCDPSGSAGDVINCRCTLGYEAVREPNGKPKRLADNPPMGDMGRIYRLLNDANLQEIRELIRQALAD
jgi:hypothetical protein